MSMGNKLVRRNDGGRRMTEYEISTPEQIVKLLYEIRNELRMLRQEKRASEYESEEK